MVQLSTEVKNWFRGVFRTCNATVAAKLAHIPTLHEAFLDLTMIERLTQVEAPVLLSSGWRVMLETHFLGGFPMFRSWEIADIGFLVMLRQRGRLVRSKVALLQSKRLFPVELRKEDDYARRQFIGFGRLHRDDSSYKDLYKPRVFSFTANSTYRSLTVGDQQFKNIIAYQRDNNVPVYYLFYNPLVIPWNVHYPISPETTPRLPKLVVGCRVLPFDGVASLSAKAGTHPTFTDISSKIEGFDSAPHVGGWKLERFVVSGLLGCKEGYRTDLRQDETLETVFFRRSAPISAAIGITIDAPSNVRLLVE
jgi:hypothetical protein